MTPELQLPFRFRASIPAISCLLFLFAISAFHGIVSAQICDSFLSLHSPLFGFFASASLLRSSHAIAAQQAAVPCRIGGGPVFLDGPQRCLVLDFETEAQQDTKELTELCGRYRRWMQLVMKRGIAPKAAERFVGLTLTMPGGDESQIFAACTDASDAIARNVMKLINESSGVNTELAEAALAQALLQIQLNKTLKSQEVSNG